MGEFAEAHRLLDKSFAIACEIGNRYAQTGCHLSKAAMFYHQDRHASAVPFVEQALCLGREIGWNEAVLNSCCAAAALLPESREMAVIFSGSQTQIAATSLVPHPTIMEVMDLARQRLAAMSAQGFTVDDLARWKAEGEAMSLDELAEYTLRTLREAQSSLDA